MGGILLEAGSLERGSTVHQTIIKQSHWPWDCRVVLVLAAAVDSWLRHDRGFHREMHDAFSRRQFHVFLTSRRHGQHGTHAFATFTSSLSPIQGKDLIL